MNNSIFLKFVFYYTDGCLGTPRINLYDQNNNIISHTKILNIPYDDFIKDIKTEPKIFTPINDLPIIGSSTFNRLWENNNSAYFIAELDITNISKITKIGISTWGNNVYPTENVFIYASNTYNGEYIELGNIYVNTKTMGIYKMGYVNVDYTINIKESSEIIKNKVINTIINHPLIEYLILQEKE